VRIAGKFQTRDRPAVLRGETRIADTRQCVRVTRKPANGLARSRERHHTFKGDFPNTGTKTEQAEEIRRHADRAAGVGA